MSFPSDLRAVCAAAQPGAIDECFAGRVARASDHAVTSLSLQSQHAGLGDEGVRVTASLAVVGCARAVTNAARRRRAPRPRAAGGSPGC